jgi:hypothetical protein
VIPVVTGSKPVHRPSTRTLVNLGKTGVAGVFYFVGFASLNAVVFFQLGQKGQEKDAPWRISNSKYSS